jgi:diadenylate cyclase
MHFLASLLRRPAIGWWDIADIAVVSLLIYEILKLIRGTRAVQMGVGAIIAIERQIGLRNYIEGGIPLDAVLTYDLLVSIFQPESPLHDGAVIVQEDRIAAAACFLPLTVNPKLSKELGSRHRAAIGLTEENDSVAIVVSEETGTISIVADGQIERGLDADHLRARLRALVLQRPDRPAERHRAAPLGSRVV